MLFFKRQKTLTEEKWICIPEKMSKTKVSCLPSVMKINMGMIKGNCPDYEYIKSCSTEHNFSNLWNIYSRSNGDIFLIQAMRLGCRCKILLLLLLLVPFLNKFNIWFQVLMLFPNVTSWQPQACVIVVSFMLSRTSFLSLVWRFFKCCVYNEWNSFP